MIQKILVKGAKVHNLKNIDLEIPLHQIVGIAGVSGSGKSSLALGGAVRRRLPPVLGGPVHLHPAANDPGLPGGGGGGALRPPRPLALRQRAWGAWHPQHLRHRDGTAQLPAAALLKACQPPVPPTATTSPLPWMWPPGKPWSAPSAGRSFTLPPPRSWRSTPRAPAGPAGAPAWCAP